MSISRGKANEGFETLGMCGHGWHCAAQYTHKSRGNTTPRTQTAQHNTRDHMPIHSEMKSTTTNSMGYVMDNLNMKLISWRILLKFR